MTLSRLEHERIFSVHGPSQRWDSPKDLPGPLNVSRRVLVTVQDEPAGGADMGPQGETFLYPLSPATTILAGIGRWHRDDSTASVCCFAFEDGAELPQPAS